jgi:hypothetical protein
MQAIILTAQMLERFQRRTKQDVDAARKHVLAATAELDRARQTDGLAAGSDTSAAFDADVNRRRMSPTPPRTVPVRVRVMSPNLREAPVWRYNGMTY